MLSNVNADSDEHSQVLVLCVQARVLSCNAIIRMIGGIRPEPAYQMLLSRPICKDSVDFVELYRIVTSR